jgi:hypothetical protein
MLELLITLVSILIFVYGLVMLSRLFSAQLSQKQKKWWLIAHIIFVIIYFAGVLGALLLTSMAANLITENAQINAAHLFARYFDWFLVIPGALGCMITGIWISVRTNWGLTRYYWIIVKTLGNIAAILFGSTFMRHWLEETITLSSAGQIHLVENTTYLHSHQMLMIGTIISLSILLFLLLTSYLKPWGKRALPVKSQSLNLP